VEGGLPRERLRGVETLSAVPRQRILPAGIVDRFWYLEPNRRLGAGSEPGRAWTGQSDWGITSGRLPRLPRFRSLPSLPLPVFGEENGDAPAPARGTVRRRLWAGRGFGQWNLAW